MDQVTVRDFIAEYRRRIGDTSSSVPSGDIISYMNTALRRLARQDGLDKMFNRRDTFELSQINRDGSYAAAWNLGRVGKIIDIPNIKLLVANTEGGVSTIRPKYKSYDWFFDNVSFAEQRLPGPVHYFTIEQFGNNHRLLFDRPPQGLVAIDMKYSAYHPRLSTVNDEILIAWELLDVVTEYVIILGKIETTDMATARALYEDLDVMTTDIKELLAKQPSGLPYRRVNRSF